MPSGITTEWTCDVVSHPSLRAPFSFPGFSNTMVSYVLFSQWGHILHLLFLLSPSTYRSDSRSERGPLLLSVCALCLSFSRLKPDVHTVPFASLVDFLPGPSFPEDISLCTSFYPFSNEMPKPDSSSAPLPFRSLSGLSHRLWLLHLTRLPLPRWTP